MALISRIRLMKWVDAGPGLALCKLTGRLRHHFGAAELAPNPNPKSIHRILVIRPGGMGDMLMLLPTLTALRRQFPMATIDIVCEKRNREVLQLAGMEGMARLYDTTPIRLLVQLMRQRYDVAIDTEQFHNISALMAGLSGAPVRIGFKVNPARHHLYTHLIDYAMDGYEAAQFARLLVPLGCDASAIPPFTGLLKSAQCPPLTGLPAALQQPGTRLVVISPGSSNRYKHWDTAGFAAVMHSLAQEHRDLIFALAGGPAEAGQAQKVQGWTSDLQVVNTVGHLHLTQTAALLKRAALFLGCDSGLGHLATAQGIPALVLFGPSDPRKWSHPANTIRRVTLPCSPCASFGYYKLCRDIPCMRAITPASVHEAAMTLLGQSAAPKIL